MINLIKKAFEEKDIATLDNLLKDMNDKLEPSYEEEKFCFVVRHRNRPEVIPDAETLFKWLKAVDTKGTTSLSVAIDKCVHDDWDGYGWSARLGSEFNQTIYEYRFESKLQKFRKNKGLSQNQLAKISGINVRSLQKYETGERDINRVAGITLHKLAQALECNIEDLLELE